MNRNETNKMVEERIMEEEKIADLMDLEGLKPFRAADLHCDTLLGLLEKEETGNPGSFLKNDLCIDANKLIKGNYALQTTALFTDKGGSRKPEHQVMRLYLQYLKALEDCPDLVPVKTKADLKKIEEEQKTGLLLSLEEGDVMFEDLSLLELWQKLGVRMIALTWNYPNAIGSPNFTVSKDWDYKTGNPGLILEEKEGLTEHGKAYVKKMEELGILVDVSHLGDQGFWDVMDIAQKPVIASHSNARALCPVSRNLSDEMIKAIAATGGVIGINFCADFLNPLAGNVSRIEDIVRHILYIKNLVGADHIALGTDYDGIHSNLEIEDASTMPKLWNALLEAGLSKEEVEKIAGGNVLRLLDQRLPEK